MSIFSNRFKYVSCRVWDATAADFTFPEIGDPEYRVQSIINRPNVGIAFSGGGTRSAAATLGQIRGLHHLGLLSSVRYVSCVSGGSWTAVPFTYLPEAWPDATFLGQVIPPDELSPDVLKKTDKNSFAHCIAHSVLLDDFVKNALRFAGDETYSRALGDIFLKAFDIDSLKRFFSCTDHTVSNIKENNPDIRDTDFYTVNSARPFLIVNGIILRTSNKPPAPTRIHFEATPLYTGVKTLHENAGSGGQDIGGGYVEPFGFDSDEPDHISGDLIAKVRLGASRHRYTLSDVIGVSGAAPAEVLAKIGLDWVGFPELKYWSPVQKENLRAKEYEFGDGGILENLGVMPLLMRKTLKIILFVNTKANLTGINKGQINDSIPPLFGMTPDFQTNHVFPKNKYEPLVRGLLKAKESGKTVMFQDRYPVLKNTFYGIDEGWETEILWVYNERVPEWEQELPKSTRKMIGHGSLGNFPHYRTFFQNPPAVIDLSAKQVAFLANLSCWNVIANRTSFEQMTS
jgi:hypothetical protein